ncbi:SPFH domain-containing protein [Pedobacter xixiisoli]|uniref:Membrane protease subunit, stomatin/prohibitin family, contains C-terminal Zn-ribbon domain n=1 Tax=Pedobacter xixiisoli TaxID=1476464 RepID=A0A285ZNE8_9SPHI|nr:SPFH domain-containing protein [Pedobacter xixiisoli]SOD11175.1 Membrane protease subunit, stomatin/prohibitin family, contains C-terminal Zn-ribbon domain [Pedobacter xixiisoli]
MGLGNFFRKQLSQVIEWNNQNAALLVYKFPSANDEIKNSSKLIVAPGQGVILVYEGKIADHITENGIYDIESDNHPFITTLLKLRTNFESEHKLKIYFYRTSENVNLGWGTSQAIKYMDPVYKIPVELGANGSFSFKAGNPLFLFENIIGSRDSYTVEEAKQLLQSRFPQAISSILAKSLISYQEIDSQLPNLAVNIKESLNTEAENLGLVLTDFKVNGTIFDEGTKARIEKIADITTDTFAAKEGGLTYVELEKLKALRDAARNEGGLAGAGLQLGVGMELGKTFNDAKEEQLNSTDTDVVTKLKQLKLLLTEGIITQEEFDSKKKEWLDKF